MTQVFVSHVQSTIGLGRSFSREQLLVKAMLEEAREDLFRTPCNAQDTRAVDAFHWIFGEPEGSRRWKFGDFSSACEAIGVDADAFRERLRNELLMAKAS